MMFSPFRSLAPLHYGLRRSYAQPLFWRSFATSNRSSPPASTSSTTTVPAHPHDEPKNFYNMPDDHAHHGDPRKFLNPDGTYQYPMTPQTFHYENPYSHVPKQEIVFVGGKKMSKGVESRPLVELFTVHQVKLLWALCGLAQFQQRCKNSQFVLL